MYAAQYVLENQNNYTISKYWYIKFGYYIVLMRFANQAS